MKEIIPTSKIAEASQKALVKKAKAMTPEQRLEAFFNQSFLMSQMNLSGKNALNLKKRKRERSKD